MDISETSEGAGRDLDVLRSSEAPGTDPTANDKQVSITRHPAPLAQNATDSHPLMFSPVSTISPTSPVFPDLIPDIPNCRRNKNSFKPKANSTPSPEQINSPVHFDAGSSPTVLKKIMVPLEAHDLSDHENDNSVYEAHLSSNLQNVSLTMNEKEGNLNFLNHSKQSNKLRKIRLLSTDMNNESDLSSLDSSPDSMESDLFAGSSSHMDELGVDETERTNESEAEPIEPLSADDERKHARNWQRMVLPGGTGEQRTIDMRVIEPYKRVLSHGGYLRAGGNTAIVLFSACYLPDKSRCDYDYVMDNLFLYVLWTLERLITEDYVLVYLHGGATRLPSFSWLKRCYHMVGRRLRKNLSHLYLVHPTLWIKTMLFMAKPFISSKFYRKITFIASLVELKGKVPIELAAIPEKVKAYDNMHCKM